MATLSKHNNKYHLMSDYDNFWLSLLSREFSAETPEEALKKSYGLVAAFMRRYAKQIVRLASQLDEYKKEL